MQLQNGKLVDYKLYITGQVNAKNISLKDGRQTNVLNFRAYHPYIKKLENGTFERQDSTFYDVEYFHDDKVFLDHISGLLKDGMLLRASGLPKVATYTNKEGKECNLNIFTAYYLAVDLKQKGLKAIDFVKESKESQG